MTPSAEDPISAAEPPRTGETAAGRAHQAFRPRPAQPAVPDDGRRPGFGAARRHGGPDRPATSELKIVPRRHPWRWLAIIVIGVLTAMLVNMLVFSHVHRNGQLQPRIQWGIIGHYFLTSSVLNGIVITLYATAIAMVMGILIGIILAVMRLSPNPIVSGAAWTYTWFFRGTPVLVQIYFWFDIAYIFPQVSFGIPFGPSFFTLDLNTFLTAVIAGILALGLNEGAYMAEIVRAGILSVDSGQVEAATSLGMRRISTMRRIVLPQAMRVIIPVTGNETISMLKTTSLLSVIAVGELLYKVIAIYSVTYQTVPLLIVASLWYLIITTVLTIGQFFVERYYSKGQVGVRRVGFLETWWMNVRFARARSRIASDTGDLLP
ncbi:MAG: amino acid ABC transporter permease [Acidimicrobiales bacterium]